MTVASIMKNATGLPSERQPRGGRRGNRGTRESSGAARCAVRMHIGHRAGVRRGDGVPGVFDVVPVLAHPHRLASPSCAVTASCWAMMRAQIVDWRPAACRSALTGGAPPCSRPRAHRPAAAWPRGSRSDCMPASSRSASVDARAASATGTAPLSKTSGHHAGDHDHHQLGGELQVANPTGHAMHLQ